MDRITTAEARYIANAVKNHSGLDLSGYALANFRLLLGMFSASRAIKYTDLLINRLLNDPELLEELIKTLELPDLEMFRDPEFWVLMRKRILPGQAKDRELTRIWMPHNSSGEELFSLLIIIHELGLSDKFEITAGNFSISWQSDIRKGILDNKKFQVSMTNYEAAEGKAGFKTYFTENENRYFLNLPELSSVVFHTHTVLPSFQDKKFHIILLRNRLLMFTGKVKEQILRNISGSLENNGILILGYRENLPERHILYARVEEYKEDQIYKTRGVNER